MAKGSHADLWASRIERMTQTERTRSADFNPYVVTPEGRLCLRTELLRLDGRPGEWPVAPSPGWTRVNIDGTDGVRLWCGLGSEFLFGQSRSEPLPVHVHASTSRAKSKEDVLRALHQGEAFAFCDQLFFLPDETDFTLNSFCYHVENKEPLSVFVGYRGQTQAYRESLSPGVYRSRNNPTSRSVAKWSQASRILGNVLKQRFFENENKPLTDIEAVGVMQHHFLAGPTDLLDLTFDLNVAKWFALNERTPQGGYRTKQFATAPSEEDALRDASRIFLLVVRPIGSVPIPEDDWKELTAGVSVGLWDGYADTEELSQFETTPHNLGPLWSEYPKRQSGFGLRGVGPMDSDPSGAVLAAWEYLYHPGRFPRGWDRLGGPDVTLGGHVFLKGQDSSDMAEHLFPCPPGWLTAAREEATRVMRSSSN